MSTTAAEGYSSEEDSRGGLLHNPFGIVSPANPAKRIKVDLVPAKKPQVDAAPHVLAEVCTQNIMHHAPLFQCFRYPFQNANLTFSAGHYESNISDSPSFRHANAR